MISVHFLSEKYTVQCITLHFLGLSDKQRNHYIVRDWLSILPICCWRAELHIHLYSWALSGTLMILSHCHSHNDLSPIFHHNELSEIYIILFIILLNLAESFRMLQNLTDSCRIFKNLSRFAEFCRTLQNLAKSWRIQQNLVEACRILQTFLET